MFSKRKKHTHDELARISLGFPWEGMTGMHPPGQLEFMYIKRTSNLIALILHIRDHGSRNNYAGQLLLVTDGGIFKQQMPAIFPVSLSHLHCLPQKIRTVQEGLLMPSDFLLRS